MNNEQHTAYKAVITVDLPDAPTPFEVSVTLYPSDNIQIYDANGQETEFKPLRECTLADLMSFADALENELWREYESTPLSEFAKSAEGAVKVKLPKEIGEKIEDRDAWWRSALVALSTMVQSENDLSVHITEPEIEQPTEPESEQQPESAAEPVSEQPPDIEAGEDATDAAEPIETAAEETAEPLPPEEDEEPTPDESPAAPAVDDDDFASLIVVSEPEAVFEERESVPADGEAAAEKPVHVIRRRDTENRLAGYRLPLDDPTPSAVDVLFDEHPFREAQAHALSSMSREVAGMMVGPPPEKQPNGRYVVHVTDIIEAKHTRMQGASVTYTPESWRYVNDVLLERYPNEECVIVGWYHTHPGFGIFLSNMDLFIHHNFFIQKWHIALVLDPVGKRSGFFTWNRAQSDVMAYHFPWPYWAHASW